MAFVRWSTPVEGGYDPTGMKPTSDLYIYEDVGGYFAVLVAENRHRPTRPVPGANDSNWLDWLNENREPIDHPDAGGRFHFKTMREVIAKVEELVAAGFLAPDWLIARLREDEDAVACDPQFD